MSEVSNTTLDSSVPGDINLDAAPGTQPAEGEIKPPEDLAVKLAKLEARYESSSNEGKRLHQENLELKQRLERVEQERSLKAAEAASDGFPSLDAYIAHWTKHGDKTEAEARSEYQRELMQFQMVRGLQQKLEALERRAQFEGELRDKALAEMNPVAREATAFWADIPEMNALPITEKIKRYQTVKERTKPGALDLSEVKRSAGGGSGGASPSRAATGQKDEDARRAGFKNAAHMEAVSRCSTAEEYANVKKQFGTK